MKKYLFCFIAYFACCITSADANWQYPVGQSRDSWDGDDGMRFVISVRGGAAYGRAKIQNEIGGLTGQYVINIDTGEIVTRAWQESVDPSGNYADAGYGRLGDLPAASNYSDVSVAAGVSLGVTLPHVPQWRIEVGVDHISESDYNQNPLFEGNLPLSSGLSVEAQSGGVQSSLASDVYSVMAFYDFFDGLVKPLETMIPYVGIGAGFADTKTILQLTDLYGDLSDIYELQNFGIVDEAGVIQFNKAETRTTNIAPMAAVGFSYGINERMFIDAGVRALYLPKIKWQLTSAGGDESVTRHRDWFSAEKMIYVNAMIGLRIEF
ncbi:MAG: hypothetical protein J5608_01835 [Alphaproteobacteria bacterium]|nr:hypothetical protein [Alphaproteobacteria bacterium]